MPSAPTLRDDIGPLSPTSLGSFVKLERCDQYLAWQYLSDDLLGKDSRYDESLLSPLYAESGTRFEADQLRAILETRRVDVLIGPEDEDLEGIACDQTWEDDAPLDDNGEPNTWDSCLKTIIEQIKTAHGTPTSYTAVCFQPSLAGTIGSWEIAGKPDIIVIRPPRSGTDEEGDVVVDVLEVKASAREQTHHRIQAACYSKLIKQELTAYPNLERDTSLTARAVNRANAITGRGYHNLEHFELEPTETDIEMLLQSGGRIDNIVFDDGEEFDPGDVSRADPWTMRNRMSRRCAGCKFHDVCYTRAVEGDRLELLGFPEGTQEDLADVGIGSLGDLGDLVEYSRFVDPTRRTNESVNIQNETRFNRVRGEVGLKDLERYSIAADVFSREASIDRPHYRSMIPDSGYNLPAGEPSQVPIQKTTVLNIESRNKKTSVNQICCSGSFEEQKMKTD